MNSQETIMNTREYIEVKKSGIHRHGVFASKNIPKGEIIAEYLGRLISKQESEKIQKEMIEKYKNDSGNNAATYIFIISEEEDLDGNIPENDARYINHSCSPNCKYVIEGKRVFIRSIRDIDKGEEITYNYDFEIDSTDPYEFKDHPCKCGSKNCVGYILAEDEWSKMRELLDKENNKKTE